MTEAARIIQSNLQRSAVVSVIRTAVRTGESIVYITELQTSVGSNSEVYVTVNVFYSLRSCSHVIFPTILRLNQIVETDSDSRVNCVYLSLGQKLHLSYRKTAHFSPLPLPFQNIQNIAFIFFKETSDFQNNEEILLEHPHKKVQIVSLFMSS